MIDYYELDLARRIEEFERENPDFYDDVPCKIKTRHCKYCGKPFFIKAPQQRFCCIKHKDDFWNKAKPDRHRRTK